MLQRAILSPVKKSYQAEFLPDEGCGLGPSEICAVECSGSGVHLTAGMGWGWGALTFIHFSVFYGNRHLEQGVTASNKEHLVNFSLDSRLLRTEELKVLLSVRKNF